MNLSVLKCCRVIALSCVGFAIAAPAQLISAQNPFQGKRLYVDPNSPAAQQAKVWQRSRPEDAARMRIIADQPLAIWMGDWIRDIRRDTEGLVSRITGAGALPVFVAYNIPHRDCGQHSAGGARGGDTYRRWFGDFAKGLGSRASVIILEPDALAGADCLPMLMKDERYVLLQQAVRSFRQGGAAVYIDAGHANWQPPAEVAKRLEKAGIQFANGFALNVSNFQPTELNITYGRSVSQLVGGKHFLIDTSRNGRGGAAGNEWCNPRQQALGLPPTTNTGTPLVDAFLWIKSPGQSDGTCNGGPRAGQWWPDYALELSKMADVLKSMVPR
ncbi:MAG: glycoside hydrolase family 6 protein [Gemmatimonadota bacterium]